MYLKKTLLFSLQQSPSKLHAKYDGNSNVTNPSASIISDLQQQHQESNSSPLSQQQLSPRSNTSSSPSGPVPGELWSVARLSLDRREQTSADTNNGITHHHQHHHIHNRLPFYRNDLNLNLNKHFHATAFSHITSSSSASSGHSNTEVTTRQGHSIV